MTRTSTPARIFLALILVLIFSLCSLTAFGMQSGSATSDVNQATLTRDKDSYLPGETILFTGSDFAPGESVTIFFSADSSQGGTTLQAIASDSGSFTVSATMPDTGTADPDRPTTLTYTAKATGLNSGSTAQAQFTVGHSATDAERMITAESYWNTRLTYPTGRFNPQWVRNAAKQHARMHSGIPRGRRRGRKTSADSISDPTLAQTGQSSSFQGNSLNNSPLLTTFNTSAFTPLGPQPEHMSGCNGCYDYGLTSGRVNDIVIDPTTTTNGSIVAYLGAVGGGVWKTTNCCSADTTWTSTTDDPLISTTAIDSLVIDPNNHNTIYAGTGDLNYGSFSMGSQGILKTTDGGNSWTVLGADIFGPSYSEPAGQYPQYAAVGKVRVDPNNSNIVMAGTKKGLYISYDAGADWTGPCLTNTFTTQRQDITGLDLSNIGGTTRIIAAVGVRGFATAVQYDLGNTGANGLYKAAMPATGCPTFTSIASDANGFSLPTLNLNAGSGLPYVSSTSGNQLGRIDIAVAPSNPNVIYAQVQSITPNNNSGCGNANGCQLGAWVTTDGANTWTYLTNSNGNSLRACASGGTAGTGVGSAGGGDYPQNWYDQGVVVDPNNPDRAFFNTFETWLVTRTGTDWYNLTCGYSGNSVSGHVVHVDHHAQAFVPGNSDILLIGDDGGIHGTANASVAALMTARPTWFNMDGGLNTIEFYAGDISGNFATSASPAAVGGAQDNGPSSVTFSGNPTGPVQWQMGLGGDGFSGQIDPIGTGSTQAQGTITLTTGGATAGQTFMIGSQTFTFVATRSGTGQVTLNSSTTTEGNNIVTAINTDIPSLVTAARSSATVVVTATNGGSAGNSIAFANVNSANFSMDGGGFLGGTTQGDDKGGPRFWEGNNSGGLSRCVSNCSNPGASWSSRKGGWSSDTQSFILPINLFHGGIPGGDNCGPAGLSTGCGHLIAGTTRVWETISGATSTNTWYVTNNPITANLTKGTLGNRSYINQVKYSPKRQSIAIAGTNDGNVQFGFNLGTGAQAQAVWVDVTGGNAVLPNRPVLGIAVDPTTDFAPIGYAAMGGFNENTPSTPGHIFRVVCTTNCASSAWTDKSGNLPNIPVDSIIPNPNFPQQVFAGSDFGLYYTDDITAQSPVWQRFSGVPAVMIWDMQIDRGATTLSLWTRGRGAYAWPLPLGPENALPTTLTVSGSGAVHGTGTLSATITSGGNPVSGKSITFTLNSNGVGSAVTDANGVATLSNVNLDAFALGTYPSAVSASFAGDTVYSASTATGNLTVYSVQLITTATLTKLGDGSYQANVTIKNNGGGTARNVQITASTLGSAIGSPLPNPVADIPAGGAQQTTMNFPATAGNSGAGVIERYSGTYNGGTFVGSIRAVLP
jgi:hypothetical protein